VKLDPPEFPHLVVNEAYFVEHARAAHLSTVDAEIVHDVEGRPGLVVRRFDRATLPGGEPRALACEDACQVLGRWPADKYNMTTEAVITALADRCAARPVALRALFQQVCFAWLTGNGDQHAKNLSILMSDDGEWLVSPAYDLPSTVVYGDKTLALTIGGRDRGLSRRHLLDLAAAVGLPDRSATAVLDGLLESLDGLEVSLRGGALPFTERGTADMVKELRYRHRLAQG
jgi:serine/threonine-protein kinase HipA